MIMNNMIIKVKNFNFTYENYSFFGHETYLKL